MLVWPLVHFCLQGILIGSLFNSRDTFLILNGLFQIHYNFCIFHVIYTNRAEKNRTEHKRMARNMAFLFTGFLSRFLFFCIMTPICCAPVVLGNDSLLIASTEAWMQELPITKLEKLHPCSEEHLIYDFFIFKTRTLQTFVV